MTNSTAHISSVKCYFTPPINQGVGSSHVKLMKYCLVGNLSMISTSSHALQQLYMVRISRYENFPNCLTLLLSLHCLNVLVYESTCIWKHPELKFGGMNSSFYVQIVDRMLCPFGADSGRIYTRTGWKTSGVQTVFSTLIVGMHVS